MPRAVDQVADLRVRITRLVREATGLQEQLAYPIAEAICRELQAAYGPGQLYLPAPSREERNRAIREAWELGQPIGRIAASHGVDRSTVYRVIRMAAR
ncbi:Mor transcription activator family protein [Thiococcus pfennigii]|uniref:Mor transcription activator family protein n=1 Tax=Thiococcus pfennigii TaxID=1057 RepID=UPI001907BAB0|nr:Mor transcription activator family protein [Thiococcus pfennigii]MBK1699754.1 hypothetical protein [Thiococcus pfennigii]